MAKKEDFVEVSMEEMEKVFEENVVVGEEEVEQQTEHKQTLIVRCAKKVWEHREEIAVGAIGFCVGVFVGTLKSAANDVSEDACIESEETSENKVIDMDDFSAAN